MKTFALTVISLLALSQSGLRGSDRIIWHDRPAKNWQSEAFPLGNGRMGCMVFGGLNEERIQFNVDSLWTGDQNSKGAYETAGMGAYQNFGDLYISLNGGARIQLDEVDHGLTKPSGSSRCKYRRELDIARAECKISYEQESVAFVRETICSYPDQVLAVRFSASEKGKYTGRIRLKDGHGAKTEVDGARMTIAGKLVNGLEYEVQVLVKVDGGEVHADGEEIVFSQCNGLTLYLAAGTSYIMDYAKKFMGEHPHKLVTKQLDQGSEKSYEKLLHAHIAAHRALFDRVSIDVGATAASQLNLPMDQRLKGVREGVADPDLEELLFQFGRYLLISCSRPGSLPANLQGLWNDKNNPAWHADYHSNINLQMNYWGAEPANLAECHTPLLDMLMASREPFREGTRASFGEKIRGFTIRTSHNPYGGMGWKWNIPASAWYARHFWEHYEFGQDKAYLKSVAYPYLKETCEYWEDHLKELPDGRLVAPNGWSPEHGPTEDGVAHDQQIIWDLFSNYVLAAEVLDIDEDYCKKISQMRDRLVGPKIGRWGQLQEWMVDRDDPNTRHRHTSHLYAVFPGQQISTTKTPELAKAAAVSLKARGETGDSRREWAWTWRTAMWARFGEPENCHRMLTSFLKYNMLDNLLATHPPLQLDGSLGITGSICEMLLQSHAGEIELLPAIPHVWATGSVKGLRARGGYEVDIRWKDGKLTEAEIRSNVKGRCTVRYGDKRVSLRTEKGQSYKLDGELGQSRRQLHRR